MAFLALLLGLILACATLVLWVISVAYFLGSDMSAPPRRASRAADFYHSPYGL